MSDENRTFVATIVQAQPFRLKSAPDPEELGSWVIEKGLPLRSFDRGQTFTATLPLDFLNKGSFAYKYVRADAIPEWERGKNREWRKPDRPLHCGYPSLTMNDGSFRSGQPMGDEHANKIGYLASNAAAKDWTQSHLASIRADLHESETRVQRMIKMESERLQQLFNRAQHETHGCEECFAWFPKLLCLKLVFLRCLGTCELKLASHLQKPILWCTPFGDEGRVGSRGWHQVWSDGFGADALTHLCIVFRPNVL